MTSGPIDVYDVGTPAIDTPLPIGRGVLRRSLDAF